MKKYIILLLLTINQAFAVSLVSDPYPASSVLPTNFGITVDALPKQQVAATSDTTGTYLKYDITGISTGPHKVSVTAIKIDPVWGTLESAPSVINFTRPASLAQPAQLNIVP